MLLTGIESTRLGCWLCRRKRRRRRPVIDGAPVVRRCSRDAFSFSWINSFILNHTLTLEVDNDFQE